MKFRQPLIKQRPVPFAEISADKDKFFAIVEDMRRNAGSLIATPQWLAWDGQAKATGDMATVVNDAFSEQAFTEKFSRLDRLLTGWIGDAGKQGMDARTIQYYDIFLRGFDPLNLWKINREHPAPGVELFKTDAGSVMELNLLYAFAPNRDAERTTVVELGGGYGRLAEAALNVLGDSVRYVLVDSVPGSLHYAGLYLKRACPHIKIGSYYDGDPFDLDRFGCYIIPSWEFKKANTIQFDICINIDSFQEMNQSLVDEYIALFDTVTHQDSLVYISNSHDYIFKGDWNYPAHWQKLFCGNTPRPWINNHPTEIFLKKQGDFTLQNAAMDANHRFGFETAFDMEISIARGGIRKAIPSLVSNLTGRLSKK